MAQRLIRRTAARVVGLITMEGVRRASRRSSSAVRLLPMKLQLETLETRQMLAGEDVVMFNDHVGGTGTHINTTRYGANATATGLLKNIETGADTSIRLTTSQTNVVYEHVSVNPAAGTDAYNTFNGYVTFGTGLGGVISIPSNGSYTHQFTGLGSTKSYEFTGTAIRGTATMTDRWTLVTLVGAESFTPAHSTGIGVVTAGLQPNQVAIWTGANHEATQGFVARWTDIRAGSDGEFSTVSTQYLGPTPGVGTGSAAGGGRGYGISGIQLVENDTSLRVSTITPADDILLTSSPADITVVFSQPIAPATVSANDLTIDGVASAAVTVVDARTIRWTPPASLGTGQHTIQLAAGVLTESINGLPLEAFTSQFSIVALPGVTNLTATQLTPISGQIGATIVSTGGDNPDLTLYWGDNDGGASLAAWDHAVNLGEASVGSYSLPLDGLTGNTTYYYRAAATNFAGTTWASTSNQFVTPSAQLPVVTNSAATNVSARSARMNGSVVNTGGEPPMVTIYLGDEDGGTNSANWDRSLQVGSVSGGFSAFVGSLAPETTYFYRASATNSAGTAWSTQATTFVTTEDIPLSVVINEIHTDPAIKIEPVEYIELHNAGSALADLSGWYISDAVDFTFPEGTILPPGGYLVVAENPAAVQTKYGVTALGPFAGSLANEGDSVVLRDRVGTVQDRVDYQLGFPWPTVGDAPGFSMELIHPSLDNNLGGSWRSSSGQTGGESTFVAAASQWQYFRGTQEPSPTAGAWRQLAFDDSSWLTGTASIGFGDGHVVTNLADMRGGYTSVYFRKKFSIADINSVSALLFEAQYDDGINVWINGTLIATANVPGTELAFNAVANTSSENLEFQRFPVANPRSLLVNGQNVIAVQLLNRSISDSSDAWFDGRLTESSGAAAGVTPNRVNSVYAVNAPPQSRQVSHEPQQPVSGQDVVVSVKVTDPDGVDQVILEYQLVEPGDYIEMTDPRYATNWKPLPMHDDGTSGDAVASDDLFSVTVPGTIQQHRRLVRYRIRVEDAIGAAVTVPYADDPQPNFAYYVYNGIPDWVASARPGVAPTQTYDSELLNSLPTYQLITTRTDHVDSQYIPNSTTGSGYTGSEYLWQGAFVYDGKVYDHIKYRARGGVWRFSMGKNMWKFDFNRGHGFQARDDYGNEFPTTWDKLNFSAIIQQGDYQNRGEQGLFESVGFKLFNLAGVESPSSSFVHFRIVENANEAGTSQFTTDFQGMYLALEQPDGRMLDAHGLPDGNFYKMEGGTGTLNNQGPTQASNGSDLSAFLGAYNGATQTEQWWRDNLDFDRYFSYRSIVEAIHHFDIADGKNYFYFHNPETNKWSVHAWDLDLTWADNMYGSGNEPFKSRVADRAEFRAEYRNRMREVLDLLYNTDQAYQLIDEMARKVYTPGQPSWVDADRAMWDYNPILTSSYVNSSKAGHGRYYQVAATRDFAGMIKRLKDYVVSRSAYIESSILDDDARLPTRPVLTDLSPVSHPLNELTFRTTPFSGGTGQFSAMKWRIAEVTDLDNPNYDPQDPVNYEINAAWESDALTVFNNQITVPSANLREGRTYRVRVRLENTDGFWSRWSAPIEFIAGPASATVLNEYLRVSEVMYNPADPTPTEIAAGFVDNDDFEFIEFTNTSGGDNAISLALGGVAITAGVTYTFDPGTSLAPGRQVVLARNPSALAMRYGNSLEILGTYAGSLNNGGERIKVEGGGAGEILDFEYFDSSLWPQRADGIGASLELASLGGNAAELNQPHTWRGSSEYHGSPGRVGIGSLGVYVSEVLSHTDPPVTQSDAIELHNATDATIDIGGWYLSDSGTELLKFRIPDGTLIGPQGYIVFDERQFNPNPTAPGPRDFALNAAHGDDVWLVTSDGHGQVVSFVDDVHFEGSLNGQSLGRSGGLNEGMMPLGRISLGCANGAVGTGPLVISEVQYRAAEPTAAALAIDPTITAGDLEYIEIVNGAATNVEVNGWQIRGGVDFDFTASAILGAGQTILVLPFNPADPANATRFSAWRTHYGVSPGVRVVGGYSGNLNDNWDVIQLLRPDAPPIDEPTFVPHVITDKLVYDDTSPWGAAADGTGMTLHHAIVSAYGTQDNQAWVSGVPSPGVLGASGGVSGEFTGDSIVDGRDIDALWDAVHRGNALSQFDLNGSTTVTDDDVAYLISEVLGTFVGDANLDRRVDGTDFGIWMANSFSTCGTWSTGDFDGNGAVDGSDFNSWLSNRFVGAGAANGAVAQRTPRAAAASDAPTFTDLRPENDHDHPIASRSTKRVSQYRPYVKRETHATDNVAEVAQVDSFFAQLSIAVDRRQR